MKLSKIQTKNHDQAVKLARKNVLTDDEKEFVLTHWQPGGGSNIQSNKAFFTPNTIAEAAAQIHGGCGRVVDACAGIGMLAYHMVRWSSGCLKLTCIEQEAEYVEVGRKIVPEATWVCGCVLEQLPKLGPFDSGISNPPYGKLVTAEEARNQDNDFIGKHDELTAFQARHFPGSFHMRVAEALLQNTHQGAIMVMPKGCDSEADLCYQDVKGGRHSLARPGPDYLKFKELYPEADISPTSIDMAYLKELMDAAGESWKGTNIDVRIVDLAPNTYPNPYLNAKRKNVVK